MSTRINFPLLMLLAGVVCFVASYGVFTAFRGTGTAEFVGSGMRTVTRIFYYMGLAAIALGASTAVVRQLRERQGRNWILIAAVSAAVFGILCVLSLVKFGVTLS